MPRWVTNRRAPEVFMPALAEVTIELTLQLDHSTGAGQIAARASPSSAIAVHSAENQARHQPLRARAHTHQADQLSILLLIEKTFSRAKSPIKTTPI